MPIREIPVIEEALSAIQLSIHPPRGDMEGARLPLKPAADETGQVSRDALWLHYSPDTKISFARLNEDIAKQLADAGHPMSDEFSLFLLAFARLMPDHLGSAASRLNSVLASVSDADVTLYFIILPGFPEFYQFEIPPFRLGRLRSDKLKHRSDRAGSDYYGCYRDAFRDAWAIERDPKTVRVLDLMSIRDRIFDVSPLGREREPWEYQADISRCRIRFCSTRFGRNS